MVASMQHRGPDSHGVYLSQPIALGASRLAIMDLSSLANQPMTCEEGVYAIVFNGEIYNYLELKEELEKEGVAFTTQSDTEVLLRLYIKKGVKCLTKLRGMFAFAIWNGRDQTLFLARDRMGEKPLVYYNHNGVFAFASEIKALLTLPQVKKEPDPIGLHYGFYHVTIPAPYSAFKHIRKLRPASYMIVTQNNFTIHQYWKGRYVPQDLIKEKRDCIEAFTQCLDETVSMMCRSSIPIGATLSGGLDSSTVVASMAKALSSFDTFCMSYTKSAPDKEFKAARQVADRFGTRHHEAVFKKENLSVVSDVVRSYCEPYFAFVPMHAQLLASLIKKKVTVALTGNGGDELFGGYSDHRFFYTYTKKFDLWKRLNRYGMGWIEKMFPFPEIDRASLKDMDLRKIPLNRLVPALRFQRIDSFCHAVYSDKMKALTSEFDPAALYVEAFEECNADNLFDGFLYQQLKVGSQPSLADMPDISGMASSLEYRSPFLDVNMVELAMKIPSHFKIRLDMKRPFHKPYGKWIVREAMKNHIPKEILLLKKTGFGSAIPYHSWVLKDWSNFIETKLRSPALTEFGLFDIDRIQIMYEFAKMGRNIPVIWPWNMAMVAQWLEEFF
jgi:asparagine synthase (glutamine-hydrolysing)